MKNVSAVLFSLLCFFSAGAYATQCGPDQTSFLELYTSEGCSSCPPAEAWLNKYKDRTDLWTSIVPIAFHVDYWNYLGWEDRFAKDEYSDRQRRHAALRNTRSVYTPGMMVNGKEWKGFFRGETQVPEKRATPGILNVNVQERQLQVRFTPESPEHIPEQLHIAWLGMGLSSQVKSGENAGKTLNQEFVVLDHQQLHWSEDDADASLQFIMPEGVNAQAVAVWLSDQRWQPVQACGGYVPAS